MIVVPGSEEQDQNVSCLVGHTLKTSPTYIELHHEPGCSARRSQGKRSRLQV